MRISLGDVSVWFDVSGPSVVPDGDVTVERPVVVAVHGGPGLDHMTVKSALGPLEQEVQVVYFDLRGHGRSDRSSAEFWNLRTWADDLRLLCDTLGLRQPIVLGSSFGGDVALTYAALFPGHPGGIILANTTGGHRDMQRVIETFGRLGGPETAALVQRIYADPTGDYQAEFNRVCYPLYSATPSWVEESRLFQARIIKNPDLYMHYATHEADQFDPWSLLGSVTCPVLVLAGEDDPVCPLPVVEELASQLPAETTRLVRLPGAHHTIFRDRPDLAFPAVLDFVSQVSSDGGSQVSSDGAQTLRVRRKSLRKAAGPGVVVPPGLADEVAGRRNSRRVRRRV
jgi:pimeloyl-ACP methyl ester carboxylesterase